MKHPNQSGRGSGEEVVRKPFLSGSITDDNTIRNCMQFFGILILVYFVSFIACATASFDNLILRLILNTAVIAVTLMIFYNNGAGRGADAVTQGEILYQKQEKGRTFTNSERAVCFHPMKGYLIGLISTLPFLIAAAILAVNTSVQMTDAGTLPSWMQGYIRRSDIGNALISYTNPEGMQFIDYLRAFVRICILPFINITGYSNKIGLLTMERISPLIVLLPAISFGSGYLKGKKIRTHIHTVISENDKRRIRKENKRRSRRITSRKQEPEQLN